MAFLKFSKGKKIYSVPNGLGDGSAYFDGNSYAKKNSGLEILPSGTNPCSFSVWFNLKNFNTYDQIFAYGRYTNNGERGLLVYKKHLYSWGYVNDYEYTNTKIELNTWYHVVMVHENAKEKVYLNEQLVGERNFAFNTGLDELCIGMHDNTYCLTGNIKEVKVYNRALSADEVTQLYNKQEITSGRVLYIPLQYGKDNESLFSSKSFVYDYATLTTSSGFDEWGYPIRYDVASDCGINFTTIPTDNLILYMALKENRTSPEVVDTNVFTSAFGGNYSADNYQVEDNVPSLYLNTTSAINLTRVSNKTIRQCTVSYWGKYNASNGCIVTSSLDSNGHVNGGAEFWLAFGQNVAYFTSGNEKGNIITANMSISQDWHHIAVTWDMDTNYMYLYLDGELIGQCIDQSWKAPNINTANFVLSVNTLYRASSVIYGNGYYSSVRMYDRVLKASEIKALANEF